VTTLDDRILNVSITEMISQETATVVKGEGMPVLDTKDHLVSLEDRHKHGDLIIKFEVDFPKSLTTDQKQKLNKIISS